MKLHANTTKISTTEYVSTMYKPVHIGKEASICGSCPYDKCVEDNKKTPCNCEYYNEKIHKSRKVRNGI